MEQIEEVDLREIEVNRKMITIVREEPRLGKQQFAFFYDLINEIRNAGFRS